MQACWLVLVRTPYWVGWLAASWFGFGFGLSRLIGVGGCCGWVAGASALLYAPSSAGWFENVARARGRSRESVRSGPWLLGSKYGVLCP